MTQVWVTRPQRQAQTTCALLAEQGYVPWAQPVMEITPLAELPAVTRAMLMDLDLYHIAIFISQNAVHYGLASIDQFWPQIPVGVQFLAVGNATARALAAAGILADSPQVAMDSEALLALPALQQVEQQRVIIFKGEGGRTTLAETLAQRGARVDNCELYQRRACAEAVAALQASDFGRADSDCTMAYSGESVQLIEQTLVAAQRKELLDRPLVVPGLRVAKLAAELGFSHVLPAENATDMAMMAALMAA